eukprot:119591_1
MLLLRSLFTLLFCMRAAALRSSFLGAGRPTLDIPRALSFPRHGVNSYASRGVASVEMMPIGIPKVAYRIPGAQQADWVDIYNRMYRERIIFLGQEIDDEFANQIIGVMLYLDQEDSMKPIYLYINCPGGSVIAGLAIHDTMQHIKSEVITINLGLAASMASFLLAAGQAGKRMALPHSRVMIHQPMGGAQGQAEDIKVEAAQIMRIRDNIVKMYGQVSGRTLDEVTAALDRDNFMSAQQALDFGLIDRVCPTTPPQIVIVTNTWKQNLKPSPPPIYR